MSYIAQPWLLKRPIPAPSLDLNFLAMTLDSRITFTRAAGPATYFDSAGTMQTAGTNVARFDYDPATRAPRGLLIEEPRTNLLTYSADFTNVNWARSPGVTTVSGGVAPDGGSAIVMTFGTGPFTVLSQDRTVANDASAYAASFYLKAGTAPSLIVKLEFFGGTGVNIAPTINTSLWTASPAAGTVITNAGGGWYRVTVMLPNNSSGNTTARHSIVQNGSVGGTVIVWGAQLELGPFSTSYIPTTTAAATRAADVATMPAGTWFNGRGTWAAALIGETTGIANAAIVGDNLSAMRMLYWGPGNTGVSDGTGNASATIPITSTPDNIAASVAANGVGAACGNGGLVIQNTGFVGFGAVTTIRLMADSVAAHTASGWLRRVRYWPRAMGASELQGVAQ